MTKRNGGVCVVATRKPQGSLQILLAARFRAQVQRIAALTWAGLSCIATDHVVREPSGPPAQELLPLRHAWARGAEPFDSHAPHTSLAPPLIVGLFGAIVRSATHINPG